MSGLFSPLQVTSYPTLTQSMLGTKVRRILPSSAFYFRDLPADVYPAVKPAGYLGTWDQAIAANAGSGAKSLVLGTGTGQLSISKVWNLPLNTLDFPVEYDLCVAQFLSQPLAAQPLLPQNWYIGAGGRLLDIDPADGSNIDAGWTLKVRIFVVNGTFGTARTEIVSSIGGPQRSSLAANFSEIGSFGACVTMPGPGTVDVSDGDYLAVEVGFAYRLVPGIAATLNSQFYYAGTASVTEAEPINDSASEIIFGGDPIKFQTSVTIPNVVLDSGDLLIVDCVRKGTNDNPAVSWNGHDITASAVGGTNVYWYWVDPNAGQWGTGDVIASCPNATILGIEAVKVAGIDGGPRPFVNGVSYAVGTSPVDGSNLAISASCSGVDYSLTYVHFFVATSQPVSDDAGNWSFIALSYSGSGERDGTTSLLGSVLANNLTMANAYEIVANGSGNNTGAIATAVLYLYQTVGWVAQVVRFISVAGNQP